MPDSDPDVVVLNTPPPAPGAAAVFQGMLSVLGEELESLHRGMTALVAPQNDLVDAVDGIDRRLERLEIILAEREGENPADVLIEVQATVVQGLAALEERMAAPLVPANDGVQQALAGVVERLDDLEGAAFGALSGMAERVERLGRVGDGLVLLQEAVDRTRGETEAALDSVQSAMSDRVAATESALTRQMSQLMDFLATSIRAETEQTEDTTGIEEAVQRGVAGVADRLERLERAATETADASSSSARALTEVASAVTDIGARLSGVELQSDAPARAATEQAASITEAVRSQLSAVEQRMVELAASPIGGGGETHKVAVRLEASADAMRERLAALESGMHAMQDAPSVAAGAVVESLSPAIEDINDRTTRLEEALVRLVDQADLRATTLAAELQASLGTGLERLVSLAGRAHETVAAELHGTRSRLDGVATSLAAVAAEVTEVSEVGRRLAEEGRARPVLEAIDAASRENGEVLAALHASLTRRIDARVRAVGELVEGLSGPAESTAALAAGVEEINRAVTDQKLAVDRINDITGELAAAVGAVPGGLASALGRQEAVLEQVRAGLLVHGGESGALREGFDGLEAAIVASLEVVRSYLGEGLVHVSRRQAGTNKAMQSAAGSLQAIEHQLNALAGLCQSLASGMEQQTGAASRVADLVLETRSTLRGDLERVESTVHLEALKLNQQDQARLAGAASATTEVVERETALLAQRLGAVATAVETVRTILHAHVEDSTRVPLALVKDN